ncbi:hypothetical protein MJO28_012606 [Puccinia striiformis f. sp. tritici]|uniref:Uncharacterized protein n=4 Tax=Puccinia striiformis TaxID=27350 RepID=A0A0L0VYU8_9BASI|nr:hypothetical protein Pst134EB_023405 [Puccinia striiformis f. sp. tritici]KAI9611184.1 hypothetical protein KEM48_004656 [Puccinia striiformis f. sp. tritici PST-130]KNF04451.1 hypothetical protein PSTG_02366 [Puccinia striiformis f. sp. tritici PST-78]POW15767.1 hypothetical protein PSHT_07029 [Puccinia striiformis]KAI7942579.1 hypothetical protein MJO28_012606 [Puccinia striiformis f. sp. tritici]
MLKPSGLGHVLDPKFTPGPARGTASPEIFNFPLPAQPANPSTNSESDSSTDTISTASRSISVVVPACPQRVPVRPSPASVNEQVGTTSSAASSAQAQNQPQPRVSQVTSSNPGGRTVGKPTDSTLV